MGEINSFNEIFVAAKNAKLKLEHFSESENGLFRCRWRYAGIVFRTVERRAPFTAMLDAFAAARETMAVQTPPDVDLFD